MILDAGIAGGEATFDAATPTWEQFDASKIDDVRVVAVDADEVVVGWAAASAASSREAYRGVVEHSVYLDPAIQGQGIGRLLLSALLDIADAAGYWTVQCSIFAENTFSLRLHESVGFRVVGRRERIACSSRGPHAGQWRDTVLLERRSQRTGE